MAAMEETMDAGAPGGRSPLRASAAVIAASVGLLAVVTLWLLYGDGFAGLAALSVATVVCVQLEKRFRFWEALQRDVLCVPRTAIACALAAVILLPLAVGSSGYAIHVITTAFIFAIMAVGLNVHLGGVGLINIGYGGLFALGAYSAALASNAGFSFWWAVPIAIVSCAVGGALLGICTTRTTGDYFALVTLGFGLIIHQLLINLGSITGGSNGQSLARVFKTPLDLGFMTLRAEANWYYLSLLGLALSLLVLHLVHRSWIGRTWSAMRVDITGTSCFGVNIPRMKIQTVAFGSAFAGLAGALYAYEIGFISPDDFTLTHSIELVAMVILGGIGNVWGVVAGAILLVVIPEKLRILGDYRLLVYGALLVLLLIYRPAGLFSRTR